MKRKVSRRSVKSVINSNFTFGDLSPRFKNVDSTTGNIFCPFHENHSTPAAKMYWNEDVGIWILHCFGQCHRNYTAYDYVDLILCQKYERYRNPLEFLKVNLPYDILIPQLEVAEAQAQELSATYMQKKIDYINNISADYTTTEEFIERLYTA